MACKKFLTQSRKVAEKTQNMIFKLCVSASLREMFLLKVSL
jgi:hypothetical protein